MIVAVAVCPAAPWLLDGVAPRLAVRAADIGAAAVTAVAALADTDRVVVLVPPSPGSAPIGATSPVVGGPRGTVGVTVGRSDLVDGPLIPVAPAVAGQLLTRAGVDRPATQVAATDPCPLPPDGVDDPAVRIGVLVLADGAAAHGPSAPAREDPRSAELDQRVTRALRDGRPDDLAAATGPAADPAPADLSARVDGLRVLAAWTGRRPPQQATLLAYSAPFGVGYPVAVWRWDEPGEGGRAEHAGRIGADRSASTDRPVM